jgi:hypothetical protein
MVPFRRGAHVYCYNHISLFDYLYTVAAIDAIQAAVLGVKLRTLAVDNAQRQAIADRMTRVSQEPAAITRAPLAAVPPPIRPTKGQLSRYDCPRQLDLCFI